MFMVITGETAAFVSSAPSALGSPAKPSQLRARRSALVAMGPTAPMSTASSVSTAVMRTVSWATGTSSIMAAANVVCSSSLRNASACSRPPLPLGELNGAAIAALPPPERSASRNGDCGSMPSVVSKTGAKTSSTFSPSVTAMATFGSAKGPTAMPGTGSCDAAIPTLRPGGATTGSGTTMGCCWTAGDGPREAGRDRRSGD
mmetsp:Transcript_44478/g.139495  ORF Transcript_44478/g.139495 Transcript_44478/m.139495 type:complete len:202 (+) Transcript_44478:1709-2314(+)